MSLHDPVSDLITRIRNAKQARHRYVDVDVSKIKVSIVRVLQEQGFVDQCLINDEKRKMRIYLRYGAKRQPLVQGLTRKSSPGGRQYIGYKDIPKILGGMGVAVLSTPKGIIDGETARRLKVGGEFLFAVW